MKRITLYLLAPAVATVFGALPLAAAPTVYMNNTGSCGGPSPCYSNLISAVSDVDNGGTVIFQNTITGALVSTEGKQNVTLQATSPGAGISGSIQLTEFVRGWTIDGLTLGGGLTVEDVLDSLEIRNVTTTTIGVGFLTADTTADITIADNSITSPTGGIVIRGDNGVSLGGSIAITGNRGSTPSAPVPGVTVQLNVANGTTTTLSSAITISDNVLDTGGGIMVRGVGGNQGPAELAGSIVISNNTTVRVGPYSRFGITMVGGAQGNISSDISILDNELDWIALLTTAADGSILGPVDIRRNDTEVIEFYTDGGVIGGGAIEIVDNEVLDRGFVPNADTPRPFILLRGEEGIDGSILIEDNVAPDADVVVRADLLGEVDAPVTMRSNSARILTLEARGGAILEPFEISDNALNLGDDGLLTIRSLAGGNTNGGVISGNTANDLTVNIEGTLTQPMTIADNVIEDVTTLQQNGSAPTSMISGNDFRGFASLGNFPATAQFNRVAADMSVSLATVDGRWNWWLCDDGPDTPSCSDSLPDWEDTSPWLTFDVDAACSGNLAVIRADLRTDSLSGVPSGNTTPGSIEITSSATVPSSNLAALVQGSSCAELEVFGTNTPSFTVALDSESVPVDLNCISGPPIVPCSALFTDGFEAGTTNNWSMSTP